MHSWRHGMQQALYGPEGFFTTGAGARSHFRTSIHAAPEFAGAIARLAVEVDDLLGLQPMQIVDVGAGDGELLVQLDAVLPPDLRPRVDLVGVELRARPTELPHRIQWTEEIPNDVAGLLVANEWLDNVPLDVCEKTPIGVVQVYVDETGVEELGPTLDEVSAEWLARWWPQTNASDGDRAEIGLARDIAWRGAVTKLRRGVAVAIDYGNTVDERQQGSFAAGTLRGFRDGHLVAAVPDGKCDITADVAIDACAAATSDLVSQTVLTNQREALTALGVIGRRPPIEMAHTDPSDYVTELAAASRSGELLNAGQLGSYRWLVQSRNCELPPSLAGLAAAS